MGENIPGYHRFMFIVLPPSETKTHGGDGSPLNFAELSFPELTPIRKSIAADLQALPVDAAVDALGLSEKNRAEAHAKKMWLESSGTAQRGQIPVPGPLRLRTSTPDGIRPWIHCHMKMRIFSGRRTDHTIKRGGSGGGGNGHVERFGRELARRLQVPTHTVLGSIHQRLMQSDAIKQLTPGGGFRRPKWPTESEAP